MTFSMNVNVVKGTAPPYFVFSYRMQSYHGSYSSLP